MPGAQVETWKVIVENVGKGLHTDKVKAQLEENGIVYRTVRKEARKPAAVLSFSTAEDLKTARPLLEKLVNKKEENWVLKEWEEKVLDDANRDVSAVADNVQDATAPNASVPYDTQLHKKQRAMVRVLQRIVRMLVEKEERTNLKQVPAWVAERPLVIRKVRKRNRKNKKRKAEDGEDEDEAGGETSTAEKRPKVEGDGTAEAEAPAEAEAEAGAEGKADAAAATEMETEKETAPAADTEVKPEAAATEPEATAEAKAEQTDDKEAVSDEKAPEDGFDRSNKDWTWRDVFVGETVHNTACAIEEIISSPVTSGYRNKCEFTIGFDAEEKLAVGFRLGGFKNGSVTVGRPNESIIVPKAMLEFVKVLEAALVASPLKPYDRMTKEGTWRSAMVRYFESTKQMLVMFTVQADTEEVAAAKEELERVAQVVTKETFDGAEIKSVSAIYYNGPSQPGPNDEAVQIFGDTHIYSELCGNKFAVSGSSFFQVNDHGAELMFSKVRDWVLEKNSNSKSRKTLFDVCCGTGTVGITLAKAFDNVVGVDICESAVADAAANAAANNITNTTFLASPVENVMKCLVSRFASEEDKASADPKVIAARDLLIGEDTETMAVVDPPRQGLHPKVVREIRRCTAIERLIYVSCNPTGPFLDNIIALCRAEHNQRPGTPFRLVKAVPVDLFPHTTHCELVVLLERYRGPTVSTEDCKPKQTFREYEIAHGMEPKASKDMVSAPADDVAAEPAKVENETQE